MKTTPTIIKPFLRWAGGKNWLTHYIENFLPETISNYYEPFLGGGSIFFFLKSRGLIKGRCYLSDANAELINTYQVLKSNSTDLFKLLKKQKNTKEEYYKIRSKIPTNKIERAARFLFLNKTSYNGIYRVNRNGEYNVPYGYRNLEKLYDYEQLALISKLFENCFFSVKNFDKVIDRVEEGDFVFLDPPYTVAHENNGFIEYNQKIFSLDDQKKLALVIQGIISVNASYILTNAKHKAIEEIYNNIDTPIVLSRSSTIGGIGARREQFKEYIFSNCIHH